jgi:tetratricopeptide (TPR) repeat protein
MATWQDLTRSELLKAVWTPVIAGVRAGVVRLGSAARGRVVRRRADAHRSIGRVAPEGMIDRKPERRELEEASGRAQQAAAEVVQLCGSGGVGKSALQCWNGQRNQSRYRNGRITINWLDWVSRDGEVREEDLLGFLLGEVGIPDTLVERVLPARRRQWREILSRRRLQIEVDNAQESPLLAELFLPTRGSILTVVAASPLEIFATTRTTIIRLAGVKPKYAKRMMAGICGTSVLSAEPEATAELIEWCDGVPRTLLRAAYLIRRREQVVGAGAVSGLVAELRRKGVTAALGIETAAIDEVMGEISNDARALLGLLVAHPIASVAVGDVEDAWRETGGGDDAVELIFQLYRYNLLEVVAAGRFRTTNLVRDCVRRGSEAQFALDELWWPKRYCERAQYADLTLNESRMRLWQLSVAREDSPFVDLDHKFVLDSMAASLPAQRVVIEDAATRHDHRMVVRIVGALEPLLLSRGHHDFFMEVLGIGIRVAREAQGSASLSRMLCQRAWILLQRGLLPEARPCLDEAMSLAEVVGNAELLASVCEYESRYQRAMGRLDRSVEFLDKAIEFDGYIEGRNRIRSRGIHERMKANDLVGLDEPQTALDALALAKANTLPDDDRNRSRVWLVYCKAYRLLSRFDEALSSLDAAHDLVERTGSQPQYERELAEARGDVAAAQASCAIEIGDLAEGRRGAEEAVRCWTIVRDLYRNAAHSKAADFQARIDDLKSTWQASR